MLTGRVWLCVSRSTTFLAAFVALYQVRTTLLAIRAACAADMFAVGSLLLLRSQLAL